MKKQKLAGRPIAIPEKVSGFFTSWAQRPATNFSIFMKFIYKQCVMFSRRKLARNML
jgi:hypothetical protein